MKYAIVGGDKRSVFLARLLTMHGRETACFALEKAVECTATLEECVGDADCVILGVPAVKNGSVNTPLSDAVLSLWELLLLLTPAQTLCGGFGGADIATEAEVFNLLKSERFAGGNAALTAEAAIALLVEGSPGALYGAEILILGSGRLSKALNRRLSGFEASITVGARGASTEKALSEIGRFDYIVNTVPARIIGADALRRAKRGAVIAELASCPGGFDAEEAKSAGLTVIFAPGLPGRFSPLASARLMEKEILEFTEGTYHD